MPAVRLGISDDVSGERTPAGFVPGSKTREPKTPAPVEAWRSAEKGRGKGWEAGTMTRAGFTWAASFRT